MTPPLPVDFLPQLIARIGKASPRFYKIIRNNSLLFTVASILVPYIVSEILPGLGFDVPPWVSFANTKFTALCTLLAGLGMGSAAVATTTIQTAATPPLASELTEPTMAEVREQLDQMREEIAQLRTGQRPPTP